MRAFLLKATLYCAVLAAITAGALVWAVGGFVDAFYGKFTQPARSLVVGSSRAAQGIDPALLGAECAQPFLNFAFTNANSPYGPGYLRAIRRKVPADTRGGLFILEVNPLLVSIDLEKEREDESTFRERDLTLDRQFVFDLDPNFDYLLRNFREPLYRLALPEHRRANQALHASGWHEVRLDESANARAARQRLGVQRYADVFARYRSSPLRVEWLRRTIAELRPHGRVVLVRIPTSPGMAELENAYAPDFSARMATTEGVEFFDFIGEGATYETTDGNHLTAAAARKFSAALGQRLRKP
ncbi:MAG: hypothetical protein ABMA13_10695 [Chthoniobacteraceae bacterium]